MKQIVIAFVALIGVLALVALSQSGMLNLNLLSLNSKKSTVKIGNTSFFVTTAKTLEEQTIGLSKTTSLSDTDGMLFIFDKKDRYSFWMRDMKMAIDIIFIDDTKVVDIKKNAQIPSPNTPVSDLKKYTTKAPANYVLEVKSGMSDKYGIKEGDTVEFSNL